MKKSIIVAACIFAFAGIALATGGQRLDWWRSTTQTSVPMTATASHPLHWDDTATVPNMRYSDGTSNNYVAACVPTTSGDYCGWNGTNWTREPAPTGGGGGTFATTYSATPANNLITESVAGGPIVVKAATASGTGSPSMTFEDSTGAVVGTVDDTGDFEGAHFMNTGTTNGILTPSAGGLTLVSGGALNQITVPQATDTMCLLAATQTLTNKTLGNTSLTANFVATGAASATNTTGLSLVSDVADGASSLAFLFNNAASLITNGSKLFSFQNNGTEYFGLKFASPTNVTFQMGEAASSTNTLAFGGSNSSIVDAAGSLGINSNTSVQLKYLSSAKVTVDTNGTTVSNALIQSPNALTDGATITVDLSKSNNYSVTLGGNRTVAFSNLKSGSNFTLKLIQDATGSRTVTWPASVKWAGGTAPTLTTTAGQADILSFVSYDGTTVDGTATLNFAP